MNQYGRRALRYWQENLPGQYGQLPDPERFFAVMGEELAGRVEELTRQIAGGDVPGEGYLAKVGRLQLARVEAETEVMRELLPQPESAQPSRGEGAAAG